MDVPPRDLICRPLAALKNNRSEAEKRATELCHTVTNRTVNGAPAASYQPGLYVMMDWVASRQRRRLGDHLKSRCDCFFELAMFAA